MDKEVTFLRFEVLRTKINSKYGQT
jgi:hypothetical protein